jgi:RNA polymerase sigma-70 factor (ECF subfamily)
MLDDQETSYLRESCWADFKAALAEAFAGLQPRQRNVLRCHLQGLTAEQIGRMYRVHRVTVARWLSAIRFELLESTRAGLRDRLAGDDRAIDSIFRMVDLDLTASLTRLVGADE